MAVFSYSVVCHEVMKTGQKYLSYSKRESEKTKYAGTFCILIFMLGNIEMIVRRLLNPFSLS